MAAGFALISRPKIGHKSAIWGNISENCLNVTSLLILRIYKDVGEYIPSIRISSVIYMPNVLSNFRWTLETLLWSWSNAIAKELPTTCREPNRHSWIRCCSNDSSVEYLTLATS